MNVKLIGKTIICNDELIKELNGFTGPEELIMYCARVSNPENQTSNKPGLVNFCLKEGHVSIFEMSDMIVEIETSRAISAQILRHRSFTFQEFSQRYAKATEFEVYEARRQDTKNRQNSIDDLPKVTKEWFQIAQNELQEDAMDAYELALHMGIAKEQARFLLPLSTKTKLYMKGNVRSWIHYISLRSGNGTQKEHRDIATAIKEIFKVEFPIVSKALKW